jgi:hypothetical protein
VGIRAERERRRRRARGASIVVVIAVIGLLAGLLAITDDPDDDDVAATVPTTPTTEPATTTTLDRSKLGPVARELLELVDSGRAGTMHILYDVVSQELLDTEATATLELWRRPGQLRQDTILNEKEGQSKSSLVGGPNGILRCDESPTQALSCSQVSQEFSESDDFLSPILDLLNGATVTVETRTIGPFEARCYTLSGAQQAEVCVDALGFPVRIENNDVVYSAVQFDQDVDDDDFQTGIQVTTDTAPPGDQPEPTEPTTTTAPG